MSRGARPEPTAPECAMAAEMFDHFCAAGTMKQILALHREICNTLNLRPNRLPDFYPKLKAKLASSWKAQALFKKFDARANHKVYGKGRVCQSGKVLIIGAGPCGLRAAIECQLLGAKVVVVEKRDRISRNNVLHLWPFVIHDLRALGAKKFFGKFCAGSIDHISIRQLQCILMKVSLLLGVEIHEGVGFEELLEPTVSENSETLGWRARVSPPDHVVSQYEFDALIGADGKRNTLSGFKRKEFRGKLAMAITANFINRHSEQEASVPEISGVAFIFNQKFFKDLYENTGIDLENIVYYKDDTHYFVMTAKKHSLLDKGVLLNDFNDVSRLLSVENVDRAALMRYALEAARFSTMGRLPLKQFALNHYGEPDVALFDFTSMYAAENASLVYERLGRRLLCQLVGDSLLEPFWPTGSGCARGFLSALDAAWAVRSWAHVPAVHPLHIVAEREAVYRLLAQTTPENLNRDFGGYTVDPGTRYPNLNRAAVTPARVSSFYDSDDPLPLGATPSTRKRRREVEVSDDVLITWVGYGEGGIRSATSAPALTALLKRYRPDLLPTAASPRAVYHVLQHDCGITPPIPANGTWRDVPEAKLRSYLARIYFAFKGEVPHVDHHSDVFHQIKQNQQQEKHIRNTADHSVAVYTNAADTDKSHSSYKKKRRSVRSPQVSIDSEEYIRNKIGRLDLDDITQLARLIEGHDVAKTEENHAEKQKALQEQIVSLLDPDESPDPAVLRQSIAQLLQGPTRVNVDKTTSDLNKYFYGEANKDVPKRPPRRLKGLDPDSIRVPDFSDVFGDESADTDVTVVNVTLPLKREIPKHSFAESSKVKDHLYLPSSLSPKKKDFVRSSSIDSQIPRMDRRMSDVVTTTKMRNSVSPEPNISYGRSNSVDNIEIKQNTKRIAQIFEGHKRRHTPSPETRSVRSGSLTNPEMALRMQRMAEIIEGKRRDTPSPERTKRTEVIGTPEMAARRQRVSELIQGYKPHSRMQSPDNVKKNSGDMAFRMQRVSDIMEKRNNEVKRPKSATGRRKAAREIMKQRFDKSIQMLATEPRLDFASTDLEHDVGLQQYRAHAPKFGERVKKLEKKLQHYEEGRLVGAGSRTAGGGARVARLAAELSGTAPQTAQTATKSSKPKDLMRSVGKIERDDWNVREIEKKILENRLGRPEPKTAEKVPKWDREQFLVRQRRLKEGENEEKWVEIDETIHKLDQKLRDSGRPDHGTNKVANLANKFVKKEEPEQPKIQPKDEIKRWHGPSGGNWTCVVCLLRVFAAERVTCDGRTLHRGCFKCAVCRCVLTPGNYTTERCGPRLVCLRHSGVSVPDASVPESVPSPTPERISLELSVGANCEIDEDEWTDRNCLASETSGAGGLSDDDDSSSDDYTDAGEDAAEAEVSPSPDKMAAELHRSHLYPSTDSFPYDDYSDDGGESSGNESCSRMREAREARRREVPTERRPPTDSSEVESEEESSSSSEESSATEVSTDSEFAREEPPAPPPAILVTEPAPPPPVPPPAPHTHDYPLSRARSAGGLATKRALELKRKYLLGEPSPPAVRKSDSTSQIDTKLEAFRSTISEFQKLLHPAPIKPTVTFQLDEKPMPDIIKSIRTEAPVDLLTKIETPIIKKQWPEPPVQEEKSAELELESDSLVSEDELSHTETAPNQSVPRVEVHDEGGELIQLDSLTIVNTNTEESDDKGSGTVTTTGPTVVANESESSESCRDATTLALTETELSDWAAESGVLDDCAFEESDRTRNKNPRTLSGPKTVHDAKNVSAISSHICGRSSPPVAVVYSNALEHLEFADEGDQDPSLETPTTPRNEGYMELVDDDYDLYSPNNDRSMNFIERSFETVSKPVELDSLDIIPHCSNIVDVPYTDSSFSTKDDDFKYDVECVKSESDDLLTPQLLKFVEPAPLNVKPRKNSIELKGDSVIVDIQFVSGKEPNIESLKLESLNFSEASPPLEKSNSKSTPISPKSTESKMDVSIDISPPLEVSTPKSPSNIIYPCANRSFASPVNLRIYSPAICRSASETFNRSLSRSTDSPARSVELPISLTFSSGSVSPTSPTPLNTTTKSKEIQREREEQTEVVRRLVLERLGNGPRKSARRVKASPVSSVPPPVPPPPPPTYEPPPPRPAPPLMPLPVTPSFSDPELARDRPRKSIMKSISSYLNRHLGPRQKEVQTPVRISNAHKSTGALQEAPPVPPRPTVYPPATTRARPHGGTEEVDERDAMQLWFEARWARLVAQRRARDARDEPASRRVARLERRLARPLSAEQQAATVAELVQVSAQRDAHQALMAADRRRSAASSAGD